MNRETVIEALRAHEGALKDEGVAHLYLFGSIARGDADAASDIDLFFDVGDPTFSLIDLARLKRRLGEMVGGSVDAMTRGSLHPSIREAVEAEAIQVF